ncbi:hypothetical protein [Ammoniphilus sp. 3BR4]|uniref:hypothetical protein n=1 Tax=Ammoniphilus sp. 3BR4 TaxID=3158265 RepID=UPI0034653B5B
MFQLTVTNLDFDPDLQIIQGDVCLIINNDQVINETQCVDIGLPSLVRSILADVHPNRWSQQWEDMPFFVCGCGDPDCKAYSFIVQHLSEDKIEIMEIEERVNGEYRLYQKWIISKAEYAQEVLRFAEQFLSFVKPLDYVPFFPQSVNTIKEFIDVVKRQLAMD